jgi:hypothetical protein
MKKISSALSAFTLVLTLAVPSLADTIHLKDGAVIRGQVIDFKDQQFTILIGAGTKGRRSRTMVYVEDVESIEFDSRTTGSAAAGGNEDMGAQTNTESASKPPRTNSQSDRSNASPGTTGSLPTSEAPPTFFAIKVAVRADNANNGWTNSGLVVRKGQRLRINASGRVSLGNGRFSTPVGISTVPDSEKLLRTEATGALIAVIGDDNDDFILIGSRHDFVAQRDGVLFLGVNEGNLKDNTGTYDVVIEAEAGSPPR